MAERARPVEAAPAALSWGVLPARPSPWLAPRPSPWLAPLAALAAALAAAVAACGPPPPCSGPPAAGDCVSAQIYVDACATPQRKVNGVVIGGVEDCALDFGAAADSVVRTVRFTNPSLIDDPVSIVVDGAAFSASPVSFTLGAGLATDVDVTVTPPAVGALDGALLVQSDANNVPGGDGALTVALHVEAPRDRVVAR